MDCVVDLRVNRENPEEMTLVCSKNYTSPALFIFKGDQVGLFNTSEDTFTSQTTVKTWADSLFKLAYAHKKQYRSVLRDIGRLFVPIQLKDGSNYRIEK